MVVVKNPTTQAYLSATCVTDNKGNLWQSAQHTGFTQPNHVGIYYCPQLQTVGSDLAVTIGPLTLGTGNPATSTPSHFTATVIEVVMRDQAGQPLLKLQRSMYGTKLDSPPTNPHTTGPNQGFGELVAAVMALRTSVASITVETTTPPWSQEFEQLNGLGFAAGEANLRHGTANAYNPSLMARWTVGAPNAESVASISGFSGDPHRAVESRISSV